MYRLHQRPRPLSLPLHQIGGGLVQEAGVVQLAAGPGNFALQILLFLFQTGDFLVDIHQIAQRNTDLACGAHGADHLLPGQCLLASQFYGAGIGHALQIGLGHGQRLLPARFGDQGDMSALARLHVHLRPAGL